MSPSKKITKFRHCTGEFALYSHSETRVQRETEVLIQNGYKVNVICNTYQGIPHMDKHIITNIY